MARMLARPGPAGRPSWRAALAALAAAGVMHALVLTGLPAWTGVTAAAAPPSMRVRSVAPVPVPSELPVATPVTLAARVDAVPARALAPDRVAKAVGAPAVPLPAAAEPAEPSVPAVPEQAASEPSPSVPLAESPVDAAVLAARQVAAPLAASDGAAGAPAFGDGNVPIPVYATRLAPPQTLGFDLRRGLLSGHAVLSWHVDAGGTPGAAYTLGLAARVAGVALLTQSSEGRIDAAGLAPQRFTDQRLRGSARAANFQRARGLIGFSGPPVEYPLLPGVQDRLSWMVQLPAIVDAAPWLAATGEHITLAVVGARGDAAVWVFRFEAAEPVATSTGEVAALKFVRVPRKPHDTQAEVWLDPAQHHLPVRARIGNPPDGEVLDLLRSAP